MALRILTGIIEPKLQNGLVYVYFNPHKVVGGTDGKGVELKTIGANGNFRNKPGKTVSLRQIEIAQSASPPVANPKVRLHDTGLSKNRVTIKWSCSGHSFIEEISYLIVGEV